MAADGQSLPSAESSTEPEPNNSDCQRVGTGTGNEGNKREMSPSDKKVAGSDDRREDVNTAEKEGLCQFFLKGKCHFGNRCWRSHSIPSAPPEGPRGSAGGEEDEPLPKGRTGKGGGGGRGQQREPESGGAQGKKPSMRTADDVISRILWDPCVDPSQFGVGYLDRFLGVLERPFSDFSWDADLCSSDCAEELALPRHRIQYFTYRGARVWDRRSRLDGVFGSTGGPLCPPFGNEATEAGQPQAGSSHPATACDQDEAGNDPQEAGNDGQPRPSQQHEVGDFPQSAQGTEEQVQTRGPSSPSGT
ncbi:leukocyte receptor cluster member 9 [Lepisosteus oculatus]|uniref:Leukocyte receptor cluster member 9 n=1 Tax=Lepisosteus oculatus TaxID=7918 RepID=W5MTX2_LEPOC|nr:PREDICTED: leukocyte receptor cluster member 9 [Lepisosteus oculatus]XP_015217249.1 PREDICTED: leukocyte receptor cluster member 9 [Lepisosteus oculatus]